MTDNIYRHNILRKESSILKIKLKAFFSAIIPFIIIILAFVFLKKTTTFTEQQLDIIKMSPYFTFLVASVIALKFNRNREFFIIVILTLYFIVNNHIITNSNISINVSDIYILVCFLVPFNILIFALLKERGILSLWGSLRIGFIVFQLLFVSWVISSEETKVLDMLRKDILPLDIHSITPITELGLVVIIIALIILIARQFLLKSSYDIYFANVLLVILIILHNYDNQILYSVFFSTAGIILIVSIIQYSYSIAFHDELTGLPSRRALRQDMMKLGVNYSIAMLDIDFFKKFNDKYGHDTGDEVLKLVASIIRDVKGGGKSFRYGGEEFTILFPGKSISDVMPFLEELREKIEKRGFIVRSKDRPKKKPKKKTNRSRTARPIKITISVGVAQKNERNKTPDTVLKAADSALYRAKKKGRNCVSK